MKAVFEIEEVVKDWAPPFDKKVTLKEFEVHEADSFETIDNKRKVPVFKVVEFRNHKALIEYNHLFSFKGYEQPHARKVWFEENEEKSFCFLWGNNGITKKLKLKSFVEEPEDVQESSEEAAVESQEGNISSETQEANSLSEAVETSPQEALAEVQESN